MSERTKPRPQKVTSESPLSATWRPSVREKAVLVGVGQRMVPEGLDELAALAETAGAEPVARVVQTRTDPDPATYVGKGKIKEVHDEVHATGADAVILDSELSPGQLRNLEERLGVKVIDRTALILDIFALHAHTREGKTQVELAQLNYLLPRLRGWGEAMSRLGGGSGTGGPIGTRGPGETKLELDRQHIRKRIAKLKREIDDLGRTRQVKRSARERSGIPQVAIAGYTNSGKSSIMNALTDAHVLVADQLFATLDPTTRRLTLPGGRSVTISDTVGFVGKLPHELVEAFRSTLEEVTLAALIVHVADASAGGLDDQVAAVREVLGDIGAAEIPEVLVLNKIDLLDAEEREVLARRHPEAVLTSARTGQGLEELDARIDSDLPGFPIAVELLIPFGREDLVARIYRDGEVVSKEVTEFGTQLRVKVGERLYADLSGFIRRPAVACWPEPD